MEKTFVILPVSMHGEWVDINGKDIILKDWQKRSLSRINGVYLHGVAERDNQYDMMMFVGDVPREPGEYKATILGRPDGDNEGILFFWYDNIFKNRHGLVILKSDLESIELARQSMVNLEYVI